MSLAKATAKLQTNFYLDLSEVCFGLAVSAEDV